MNKLFVGLLLFVGVIAQYNEVMGEKLFRLSMAAYCKKQFVEKWSCLPCKNSPIVMTNVHTFENSTADTLGFIATSVELNAIVLVFRGTLPWDLKNWISDINFIAVQYPLCNYNCKVHRGFYQAYLDIQKQVIDTVAVYRTKYPYPNLVITGHSLGAALATHAAASLMALKYTITSFYHYGSPRVGDKKFTIWFNEQYGITKSKSRVTHNRDPVPHLPFEEWGFLHVNHEIFYKGTKKDGYTTCQDDTAQDKKCSDSDTVNVDVLDHVTYYDIDMSAIVLECQ